MNVSILILLLALVLATSAGVPQHSQANATSNTTASDKHILKGGPGYIAAAATLSANGGLLSITMLLSLFVFFFVGRSLMW